MAMACWLLLPAAASALQETAAETPEAPTAETGPEPVVAARIPARAEEDLAYLTSLQARLAAAPSVTRITDSLPALQRRIDALSAIKGSAEPEQLSWRRRQNFRQQWLQVRADLSNSKSTLENRATSLQKERDRLRELNEEWTLTLQTAREQDLATLLEQRVRMVLEEIAKAEKAVSAQLDSMTSAYMQITDRLAAVSAALARYAAAADRNVDRIWLPDSEPIWLTLDKLNETGAQLRSTWESHVAVFLSVWERYRKSLRLLLVFFVTVLLLLLILSKRHDETAVDPDIAAATGFLSRPIAASLFITLNAAGWFFPTSNLIDDLMLLLILMPMLRLAPVMIPKQLRGLFYFLTALVVVQQTYNLVVDQGALQRILLLALSVTGCFHLVRTLRKKRHEWQALEGWESIAVRVAWLAAVAFFVAIVANVFGYVRLTEMLTEGTIRSAYLGIVLLVVASLLGGIVELGLRTPFAQRSRAIRSHHVAIRTRVMRVVHWLIGLGWVIYVLGQFGLRDSIVGATVEFLRRPIQIGTIDTSPQNILTFVLALWVAVKISQLLRFVLENEVYPRSNLQRGAAPTISMLVNYAIVTLGFFFAVSASGIQLSQFAIVIGALSVGIGFGLQNVVNNFVSGLILIFERPVKVGDTVEVGALMGVVSRIGIRASVVRSYDGAEVIVPNGDLISTRVINWTLSDRRKRIKVPIGVAYGSDPEQVRETLLKVGADHPDTIDDPGPIALFIGFGNSSLDFELRVWTAEFDSGLRIQSELGSSIYRALAEAGIEIPFPQQDVHLRSVSDDAGRSLTTPAPAKQPGPPDHGTERDIGEASADGDADGGGDR
jgi:potassium efflux system protein